MVKRDEFGQSAAGIQPDAGLGQIAVGCLAADFLARSAHVRRLAGQDLAQDRAQAEDIGPAVQMGDVAVGLLGRHVRRRAQQRTGFGVGAEAAGRAAAAGGANRVRSSRRLMCPARAFLIAMPPSASTLARPQSITCTSPNAPTMMFAGFRSRWITPLAWAYAIACATCKAIAQQARPIGGGLGALAQERRQRLAFHQLHA